VPSFWNSIVRADIPTKMLCAFLFFSMYMPHAQPIPVPSHEQYKPWGCSLCIVFQSPVLEPSILPTTFFSHTLSELD
jgi:hypothetical protein